MDFSLRSFLFILLLSVDIFLGVPASRRAFRYIFARSPRSWSLSLSKRRSLRQAQCPLPPPNLLPDFRSQRMPLQSLTHLAHLKKSGYDFETTSVFSIEIAPIFIERTDSAIAIRWSS